jgi:hypothetical protein
MFHACFIPIATCFASTLCHFYTFSGTNLLTRCRSASSCFLLFLYSRKASLEIFSELDETSRTSLFSQKAPEGAKKQRRGATGAPHAMRARVPPWPRPHTVWAPRGSPAAALSPTYSPRENNPRHPSHYPRKVPETPPPSTLAREGSEPLPGTLPERGIVTGGFYIAMSASEVMRE